MRGFKPWLLLIIAVIAYWNIDLRAQDDWYVSAANYARYYRFKYSKADSAATRFQFDLFMGDFYAGGWYELKHVMKDTSQNLFNNITSNALTQRYFGWENNNLTLHAGTFYEVFDRGLVLNTFRDDDVGIDLVMDGFKLNYRTKLLDFDALTATPGIGDPEQDFIPKNIIRGSRVKFKPINNFHIGGAYVSFIEVNRSNINQVNARFIIDHLDAYIEYARRQYLQPDPDDFMRFINRTGDGTYANATAYYSKFTGFFEYKNYYDLTYPTDGTALNLPPAVNRQDRLLQSEAFNSFLHIKGERGYRGNLTFSWTDYWGMEVDYARAYSRDTLDLHLNETYIGVRGNFYKGNTFDASMDWIKYSERDETRPEVEIVYELDPVYSLNLHAYMIQFQPADSADYTEKYLDITFAHAPDIRLAVGGSLSNSEHSGDPKKMGYVELTVTSGNHDLIIFNGSQRGGLVCSGGTCVYHPTFEGLRVTLLSRF